MALTNKVIRKLKLGDAATRLFSPLAADSAPLPTEEEALSRLHSLRPDGGTSAIWEAPVVADGDIDVDVIVPVYNTSAYLDVCLDSVLGQQTDFTFRVIAVDDGSTDDSGALLDRRDDPHLTVIHQENRGLAGARNRALADSRARYVYFLDSDDLLSPGCLQALLSCADSQGAAIVEGAFVAARADGTPYQANPHAAGPLPDGQASFGFACGKLFSRAVFSSLRFPEGYLYEDSLMSQLVFPLARDRSMPVFGTEAETFLYRQNTQGIVKSSRGNPKSLDSLWVTLSLYRDRQTLGLVNDQRYYEYILNMLVLTWRRTEALGEEVGRAVFTVWRAFLTRELSGFSTERAAYRPLEQAVLAGDYGRYRLFCSLH